MQTIAFCVQRRVKHGYMLQINISIMHLLAVIYSWTLLRDGTSVEQYSALRHYVLLPMSNYSSR